MGTVIKSAAVAAVAVCVASGVANAQGVNLPPVDVSSSRVSGGNSIGISGASNSVITAEDIERSPSQNLTDILGQQTGIQVQHLTAGTNGSRDTVDLRGFGAFAQSNTLILVNGRRYQDFDLQGFDFSSIPLNAIERIEITRGNSGTVVYGDGAIGGVINIVTKKGIGTPFGGKIESAVGSFNYKEGRISAGGTSGPWSAAVFANTIGSFGYRQNSKLSQDNINGNLNYAGAGWGAFLNIAADKQRQDLPGGLNNLPGNYPYTLSTPQASITPLDWGNKQGFNLTTGFNATVSPNVELIVDGGIRRKFQQALFYSYLDPATFLYNVNAATPMNYVNTVMTTTSFTPRLNISHGLFGVPNKLLTGFDLYSTQYNSDRPPSPNGVPIHAYDIRQTTAAFYGMNTAAIRPDTDLSFGGRVQRNMVRATDVYDPTQDPNAGFYANNPQTPALSKGEWQYAAHLGLEHRLNQTFTVFGRMARAFRLGNADERVGAGSPFAFTVPNFDLKTQTSYDVEGGVRVNAGRLTLESTLYLMRLTNEIHFVPAVGVNVNLDPTQRVGWETSAQYQVSDRVRVRGGVAYVNATFREGPYAGNEVPLISRWTGNAGASFDLIRKLLVLDLTATVHGQRRMDNDQINQQPLLPAIATVDAKLGGEVDRFFWSAAVLNVFDTKYYDYAIASGGIAAGPGFPGGLAPTIGSFSAYPLPGRTFMVRAGMTF